MKKRLLVMLIFTLLALSVLSACNPKKETPAPSPVVETVPEAYPINEAPIATTVSTAYPVTAPAEDLAKTGVLTDEQVLALIETQLNGHHTVDFLLSKKLTAEQWVEVINNEYHNDVLFTASELEQVIAYLIANQK